MALDSPRYSDQPAAELSRVDLLLRRRRYAQAVPFIAPGSHVLDIGSSDLSLFEFRPDLAASGVGIDVDPQPAGDLEGVELRRGTFPDALHDGETFDVVVMLAVAEHIQPEELRRWGARLPNIIRPGGALIVTVPSPAVDPILHTLIRLRVVAGIAAHEHYGFKPAWVPALFSSSALVLEKRSRFQLGLNNLFVLRRR